MDTVSPQNLHFVLPCFVRRLKKVELRCLNLQLLDSFKSTNSTWCV